ncbi:hypothetical protein PULV_a4037 [Pseudoalteromonas ulvae UL12]|uniref:TraU family protein n=1 Tax=Pseudoalteromonas ulvae TaxID=107327 RepID=UPI00186B5C54|nr:TraU family protein [Pseudoalteromonas ulvae]MBE0362222.1 hypothetical protein [Pseudoalteromonas ulvae UL12]
MVLSASLFASAPSVQADFSFDTFIKAGSIDTLSCAAFTVKGACFWIKCTLIACNFDTTAIIEHYTPDVFVSVYDSKSPEKISRSITNTMTGILPWHSDGAEQTRMRDNKRMAINYRIADVYGSPSAQLLINILKELPLGLACDPGSTPYKPYFVSRSNPFFWNTGLIDGISNLAGRDRYIGERKDGTRNAFINKNLWGYLYPRTGVVLNQDHYKASAVIAQRSIDIVFNGAFGIYSDELDGSEGQWYRPSMSVEEWSTKEGKWQMLYPKYESGCHILGEERLKRPSDADMEGWGDRRSDDGDYIWHYWRRYECCQKPSGYSFIGKVRW